MINVYLHVMKSLYVAVLVALPALADCPSGKDRKPTQAEAAFYSKAMQSMAAAFPEAPEGFVKPNLAATIGNLSLPSLCTDTPAGHFRLSLTGTYNRANRVDESKTPEWAAVTEIEARIASAKQFPPDVDARYKALQAEMSAASSASRKAQRTQDNETAKAQRAVADAKYAEMSALEAAHKQSVQSQLDALYAQRSKLVAEISARHTDSATFTIEVNQRAFDSSPDRADVLFFGKPARGLRVNSVAAQLVAHPITRALFTIDKAKFSSLIGLQ